MAKTITLHGHNYTVINPNTDRACSIKRAFAWSTEVDLDDAYGRYSHAKKSAYEYCRARESDFNSFDGRITGHNTCTFSYAFTGYCNGKKYLIYITRFDDYAIELDE